MEIEKIIKEILAEQLNQKLEQIQLDSSLIKDLKADSLDVVELVMTLEEKFNIQIPDEEAEKISTVRDIVNYMKKHTEK